MTIFIKSFVIIPRISISFNCILYNKYIHKLVLAFLMIPYKVFDQKLTNMIK